MEIILEIKNFSVFKGGLATAPPLIQNKYGRRKMRFSLLYSWIFVLIKFVKRCICGRKKIKDEDDSTKLPTSVSVQQSASKQEVN
jgi:hypothetical protein